MIEHIFQFLFYIKKFLFYKLKNLLRQENMN